MRLLPIQAHAVTLGIRSFFNTQVSQHTASHSLIWSPRYSHTLRERTDFDHIHISAIHKVRVHESSKKTHRIENTLALFEVKSGAHSMCDEIFIQLSLRLDFVQVCSLGDTRPTASNSDSNYWISTVNCFCMWIFAVHIRNRFCEFE